MCDRASDPTQHDPFMNRDGHYAPDWEPTCGAATCDAAPDAAVHTPADGRATHAALCFYCMVTDGSSRPLGHSGPHGSVVPFDRLADNVLEDVRIERRIREDPRAAVPHEVGTFCGCAECTA